MDISVAVPHLPGAGETVLGDRAMFTPGGKGANQAVAAARLGAQVRMAGCAGDDDFGRRLISALRADGVDTSAVRAVSAPTGLAMIAVDARGENSITVAAGANAEVSAADAKTACDPGTHNDEPGALVISAEIPLAAIAAALSSAADAGFITVLNLAPAPPRGEAAAVIALGVDWLVVNESEAAEILGTPVEGLAGAAEAAAALTSIGARNAVVTAGAQGAALVGENLAAENLAGENLGGETVIVPGFRVTAVDSVGAGDTFTGALATALAAGVPAADAVRAAAAAGAAAVTRPGAQAAMPTPRDVRVITGQRWPLAQEDDG
jgi:ribokinase